MKRWHLKTALFVLLVSTESQGVAVDHEAFSHPGFLLRSDGSKFYVHYLFSGLPPSVDPNSDIKVGDQIVSCNRQVPTEETCQGNQRGQLTVELRHQPWDPIQTLRYQTEKISNRAAKERDSKLVSGTFENRGQTYGYLRIWTVSDPDLHSWSKDLSSIIRNPKAQLVLDLRGANGQFTEPSEFKSWTNERGDRFVYVLVDEHTVGGAATLAKEISAKWHGRIFGLASKDLAGENVEQIQISRSYNNHVQGWLHHVVSLPVKKSSE